MPTAAMLAGQPGSVLSRIKPLVGLVSWMKYSKESCCISVSSSNEAASTVAGGRCTYGMVVIAGTANTKVPWCHGRPCPYVPHRTHGTCGNLHFAALFAELLVNFSAFLRGSCGDSRHLRLKIERGAPVQVQGQRSKRRRWIKIAVVVIVIGVGGKVAMGQFGGKTSVETVTVAQTYPAQNYTLLNATGSWWRSARR